MAYSSRLEGAARDVDDVILFNERDEVTECTIGNIVLELKGKSITLPLPADCYRVCFVRSCSTRRRSSSEYFELKILPVASNCG